jgi:predicted transcriptional regulator of viral defense system
MIFSDMAKQMNWLRVERAIRQGGLTLFSPQDLRHLLGASEMSVRFLLTRASQRGDVIKLRRELYALLDRPASDLEIANRLYHPSYVSFEYALAYYHLIPESVYEVTSATTRTSRRFEALGKAFTYRHLKPSAFTGYRPEKVGGRVALIAEPEKALVDSLYFASLGKLSLPERLDLSIVQHDRLRAWADLYQRPELVERVASLQ